MYGIASLLLCVVVCASGTCAEQHALVAAKQLGTIGKGTEVEGRCLDCIIGTVGNLVGKVEHKVVKTVKSILECDEDEKGGREQKPRVPGETPYWYPAPSQRPEVSGAGPYYRPEVPWSAPQQQPGASGSEGPRPYPQVPGAAPYYSPELTRVAPPPEPEVSTPAQHPRPGTSGSEGPHRYPEVSGAAPQPCPKADACNPNQHDGVGRISGKLFGELAWKLPKKAKMTPPSA